MPYHIMAIIDQNWITLHRREELGFGNWLLEYQKTTNGTKTLLETVQKTVRFASEALSNHELNGLDSLLGIGTNLIASASIPAGTIDAEHSLSAIFTQNGIDLGRKIWTALKDNADAILNYCACASLFSLHPLIGRIGQMSEWTFDVSDLHLSYSDYCRAAELENSSSGEIKNVFTESKNYYWFRIARAVASIAAAALGLLLVAGAEWISGFAILTLSIGASLFSILRDTHEMNGNYSIVKFDEPIQIASQTPQTST